VRSVIENPDSVSDERLIELLLYDYELAETEVQVLWKEFILRSNKVIKDAIKSVYRSIQSQDIENLVEQIHIKICADNFHTLRTFRLENNVPFKLYLFNIVRFRTIDYI